MVESTHNSQFTIHNSRCGYIALIGAPNAGKSTLLNQILGQKLSIVTPKAQTTRNRITGVLTEGNTQLVFLDTPGIFPKARSALESAMLDAAAHAISDADVVAVMMDAATTGSPANVALLERLRDIHKPRLLLLNKVDTIQKEKLLPLLAEMQDKGLFEAFFLISAKTGSGVRDVVKALAARVPEGPFLFPEDTVTDLPLRFLATEWTREQLFLRLRQELPYGLAVVHESWEKTRTGIKIRQMILVQRPTHKQIILGKKGEMLKRIGTAARQELTTLIGKPVHLFLHVKVKPDWQQRGEGMGVE